MSADPIAALNERAEKLGWTFTCDTLLAFESPQLAAVANLWQSRLVQEKLPSRADFSARDLKFVLPDLIIADVVGAPSTGERFRCRYIGSQAVRHLGEMTGAFIDEFLAAPVLERTLACYQTSVAARRPLRFVTRFSMDPISYLSAELFSAPLAQDGINPDMIMSATCFQRQSV